jgi:hypothetical protein
VEPEFLDHVRLEERVALVGDFATAVAAIVATVNVEDILRGSGQGP